MYNRYNLDFFRMAKRVYWPLSSRGFFSELLVYLYIKTVHQNLAGIDVMPAFYSQDHAFWNSCLNLSPDEPRLIPFPGYCISPIPPTLKERLLLKLTHGLRIQQAFLGCNASSLFSSYWSIEFEKLMIEKYPDFYTQLTMELTKIFPSYSLMEMYRNATKELSLDNTYDAIHVRRGDKIELGEASEIKESSILDCMTSNNFFDSENRQLVIISDDTAFAQSLSRLITRSCAVRCIVNPFSSFQTGNNSVAFTALPIDKRVDAFTSFLLEFMILVDSDKLGVTYSSNVGKALALLRRNCLTYSFDGPFSIV